MDLIVDELRLAAPMLTVPEAKRRLHQVARSFCSLTGCWQGAFEATASEPAGYYELDLDDLPAGAEFARARYVVDRSFLPVVLEEEDTLRISGTEETPLTVRMELIPVDVPVSGISALDAPWAKRYGYGLVAGAMLRLVQDPNSPAFAPNSLMFWQEAYDRAVLNASRDASAGFVRGITMATGRAWL